MVFVVSYSSFQLIILVNLVSVRKYENAKKSCRQEDESLGGPVFIMFSNTSLELQNMLKNHRYPRTTRNLFFTTTTPAESDGNNEHLIFSMIQVVKPPPIIIYLEYLSCVINSSNELYSVVGLLALERIMQDLPLNQQQTWSPDQTLIPFIPSTSTLLAHQILDICILYLNHVKRNYEIALYLIHTTLIWLKRKRIRISYHYEILFRAIFKHDFNYNLLNFIVCFGDYFMENANIFDDFMVQLLRRKYANSHGNILKIYTHFPLSGTEGFNDIVKLLKRGYPSLELEMCGDEFEALDVCIYSEYWERLGDL